MDEKTLEREFQARSGPSIWEFDLHPPPARAGMVLRDSLIDRIETTDSDVVTVVAPAGYGKTTILSQWAGRSGANPAWLTLNKGDNDPRDFVFRLDSAFSRAGAEIPHNLSWVLSADDSELGFRGSGYLASALRHMGPTAVLVLDNAHAVKSRASVGLLRELVRQLEGRLKIIIASRVDPGLPLARLRSNRRLLELTETDLSLSESEVELLLVGYGLGSASDAAQLAAVTAGWPAAISLLSGTLSAESASHADGVQDRLLTEYVTTEILSQVPKRRRELLGRLSPLDRVSGALADVVLDRRDGSDLLRSLVGTTHLFRSVEDQRGWYEMNHLVLRVLRRQLQEEDPTAADTIHRRAAVWFRDNDMPLEAIEHAQKAGDVETFVDLMEHLVKRRYAGGHVVDVLRWMDWLDRHVSLDEHPGLAAIGALVHLQEGNVLETERWIEAAGDGPYAPDTGAVVWLVRAAMTKYGVERMLSDIGTAESVAGPGTRWLPAILVTKGLAHLMNGDARAAESCFVGAAKTGLENGSLSSVVAALGQRSLVAIAEHDWELATEVSSQALTIIDEHGHDGYHTSALALIAAARCARRENDISNTNAYLARAARARPRLSAAFPGESVQILLELAKAYIELSDVVGARALIREADDILLQRPDLGVLPAQIETAKESLASLGPGRVGLTALTKAELRLLPYLATNLSFPEIGEELFISRHTVKTQAMSIYRKLGTSSRSDAVAKAHEIGLLQR